jgi:hypothetical protein
MDQSPTAKLLAQIEGYLREKRMADTALGQLALDDPNLVADLRGGRELRHQTIAKVQAFMKAPHPKARRGPYRTGRKAAGSDKVIRALLREKNTLEAKADEIAEAHNRVKAALRVYQR